MQPKQVSAKPSCREKPISLRNFNRLCLLLLLTLPLGFSPLVAAAQAVPAGLYSALKWRLIGPFRGGRAVAAAGIPGNGTTFYFGAVNGGIWKTTDAGMVWKPIFDSQHIASIGALAVAPSDPKVIYAGTGESDVRSDLSSGDGVYKSTDGGQTWANIGLRETRQISRIVVDPRDANLVFVAALGHAYGPNPDRGVYKSADGGATWIKVLDQGPETGAADLAMATASPNILFAAMWNGHRPPWSTYAPINGPGSGLFRSQDGGQTWARLSGSGLPDGDWARSGVAVSPDGRRVYAIIDAKQPGLYRSDDGGNTWGLANSDRRLTGRSWYFSSVTIDSRNPDVVYVPNVALYRSDDGGKTITVVRGAPGGDDYHQLWIDPEDSSRMVLATDQGTTISLNRGQTWSSWNNQPTAQLYHVITDDKFPYSVYGNQQDSGSIAVPSRTDHRQITAGDAFLASSSEAGYIAPDPTDPNILYVSSTYGGVARFDLRTSFSQDVTPWPVPSWGTEIDGRRYRAPWTPVLLFSPFDRKTLYLGTQFLMKTTDGGLHWSQISPDLTGSVRRPADPKSSRPVTVENAKQLGYGVVYAIAPSPLDGDLIWAGSDTGLVHLTRDGGKTWNNITPGGLSDWSKISMLEASHFNPAEAYAAVDRHRLNDLRPWLYRTRDYGATWQAINDGLPEPSFLRVIREDPQLQGLLYAGTELGVYVSFDDGGHWQSLQLNLPATSVQDLVIHGDDLVAGTHGRSFWILDDITPLRQVRHAMEAGASWLHRPATVTRVDNDSYPGTPLPPEEPSAENPPDGAIFDYYLKGEPAQVKLEVFDGKRTLVASYSSDEHNEPRRHLAPIADRWFPKPQTIEKNPGMHRFVWNLAWRTPSVDSADIEDDDHSVLLGPRIVPGTYEVRLTADGKTSSQTLNVVMDPRSTATPGELQRQFELGLQLFEKARLGRKTEVEVKSAQKQLAELEPELKRQSPEIQSTASLLKKEIAGIMAGNPIPGGKIMGLADANTALAAALRVVESSDREIPSQAFTVLAEADPAMRAAVEHWDQLKSTRLRVLNDQLKAKGLAPVPMAEIEREVDYLMSR